MHRPNPMRFRILIVNMTAVVKPPKIFLWYASYGSNMHMQRFLCYIEGGQVEGMQSPCEGSMDKTRPDSQNREMFLIICLLAARRQTHGAQEASLFLIYTIIRSISRLSGCTKSVFNSSMIS